MKFLSNILINAGLIVDGTTQLNTIPESIIDTDKFLVSDGGVIKYRTGAQVLSDIGAASANGYIPYVGATTNVDLGEFELKAGQFTLDVSPTGTAAVGTTRWNNTTGTSETTLKGGTVILKNGVDLVARVVNKVTPNATLTKAAYQAVRVSGAQGQRLAVSYAQADGDPNSADTIGLVTETIATNQEGFIMTVGQLEGINTTGSLQGETWTDGDVLYLSPTTPGAITNIKPSAPQHLVVMGYVEYAHANNGKIYVKIMNGWELGELHDVNTTGAVNGSVLKYNGTTWVPSSDTGITSLNGLTALSQAFATGTSGTDFNIVSATATHTFNLPTASATNRGALSSADWTTFNNKQNALTNPITGTGTSGQVAYFNGTNSITSNAAFAFTPTSQLLVNNSVTAATQIARGTNLNSTLIAAANNDVLVGLDINPTFTNGAFTSVRNIGLRVGTFNYDLANQRLGLGTNIPTDNLEVITSITTGIAIHSSGTGANGRTYLNLARVPSIGSTTETGWQFIKDASDNLIFNSLTSGSASNRMTLFTTGNFGINQTTDAGFRLDVNGTARVQNTLTISAGGASITGTTQFRTGTILQLFNSDNSALTNIQNIGASGISLMSISSRTTFNGGISATSGLANGVTISNTLTAAANNDVLVGLDINPTFTNGAFTGLQNTALRVNGSTRIINTATANDYIVLGGNGISFSRTIDGALNTSIAKNGTTNNVGLSFVAANGGNFTFIGASSLQIANFFGTSGNTVLGSGSDAGFRLDVNGTARVQGITTITRNDNSINSSLNIVNTSTTGANNIKIGQDTGNNSLGFGWYPSGASTYNSLTPNTAYMYALSGASQLSFNTTTATQPITFATNDWNERMRIFGGGNVIIGGGNTPTDAGFRLDVNGTARVQGTTTISGDNNLIFQRATDGNSLLGIELRGSGGAERGAFKINMSTGELRIGATTGGGFFPTFYTNGIEGGRFTTGGTFQTTASVTAASAIARGVNFNNTLVAAANNDVLVGLDIAPTFTNGAFTGVGNIGVRVSADVTGANNVVVFSNTNTSSANAPIIGLATSSTGPDPAADIRLSGTNARGIRIYASNTALTGVPAGAGFQMYSTSSANFPGQMYFDSGANNNAFISFRTAITSGGITEAMRIFSSRNVLLQNGGTFTDAGFRLDVNGTARVQNSLTIGTVVANGGASVNGNVGFFGAYASTGSNGDQFLSQYTINTATTSNVASFRSNLSTPASAFTLNTLYHFGAQFTTLGAGSAITNHYGYWAHSNLSNANATNTYGFFGDIASGTGRWNLYMGGTAANYMAGQTGVGTTTLGTYIFNVGGSVATLVNFNSTNASGFYTTYSTSGTERAYIGLGANTISGLAISDFGIVGSANVVIASGSGGTETMRIDSTKRIGIGTGSSINASAKVQIDSTTSGFLPPRMTTTQKNAIASPAEGLIVYQTDGTIGLYIYANSTWRSLTMV